jgi:hypothetical protein
MLIKRSVRQVQRFAIFRCHQANHPSYTIIYIYERARLPTISPDLNAHVILCKCYLVADRGGGLSPPPS